MKKISIATAWLSLAATLFATSPDFPADDLSAIRTKEDLEAFVAAIREPRVKEMLQRQSAVILAAAERRTHVEAVQKTVESAKGKVTVVNDTPAEIVKAAAEPAALFDTLSVVDLAVPNTGPHDHRAVDPYDAAFFAHLGQIPSLETLNVISTKANDEWIAPIGKLTGLKSLRFTNNGKLTDVGLASLAGLTNLETFSYVGTAMQGHAFTQFKGWTKLKGCSFRGSSLDDEGLAAFCAAFPQVETISFAHAKFTDAGAANLVKLTKLKGLEIGTRNATPQCLQYLTGLPLEYLQLGDGLDKPEGIAIIKDMKTLRRLTLTDSKELSDDGVKMVAAMTQLENLEFGGLPLPDERLPLLSGFAHLQNLRLVVRPQPYPAETQAKIKALLPNVALKFD